MLPANPPSQQFGAHISVPSTSIDYVKISDTSTAAADPKLSLSPALPKVIGPNNFLSTPQVVADPAAPLLTYYRRHHPIAHPTPLVADPKPIQTYSRRAKALESNRKQPGLLLSQPNSSTSIHPMITRSRKFSSQSNQNASHVNLS